MAKKKFDELNILSTDSESSENFDYKEYIDHYFDPMQIDEKQKKERIEAAEELLDAILLFFMWCINAPEKVVEEETQRFFENLYKEVVFQHSDLDEYIDRYVHRFIPLLITTTLDHIDEEYFTSVERATICACNESNLIYGHRELQQAIEDGYTRKRWLTELDERVRPTHQDLEGVTIPINEPFYVGDSRMLYPKDQYTYNADPKEVINCRCVCQYLD